MALRRDILCTTVLLFLVLNLTGAVLDNTAGRRLLQGTTIDCSSACDVRCGLSSRPHLCKRACGTCCARCNCVPPGTSGNYEKCPCYANLTTRGGKKKCP